MEHPQVVPSGSQSAILQLELEVAKCRLLDLLKVVARNDDYKRCPAHKDRAVCACPRAVASLTKANKLHANNDRFMRVFNSYLTSEDHPSAFAFTGTQESHHTFKDRYGDTAKHYLRALLQRDVFTVEFAHVGK